MWDRLFPKTNSYRPAGKLLPEVKQSVAAPGALTGVCRVSAPVWAELYEFWRGAGNLKKGSCSFCRDLTEGFPLNKTQPALIKAGLQGESRLNCDE